MIRALFELIALPFRLVFGLAHGVIGLILGLCSLVWGIASGIVWLILMGGLISAAAGLINRRRVW